MATSSKDITFRVNFDSKTSPSLTVSDDAKTYTTYSVPTYSTSYSTSARPLTCRTERMLSGIEKEYAIYVISEEGNLRNITLIHGSSPIPTRYAQKMKSYTRYATTQGVIDDFYIKGYEGLEAKIRAGDVSIDIITPADYEDFLDSLE